MGTGQNVGTVSVVHFQTPDFKTKLGLHCKGYKLSSSCPQFGSSSRTHTYNIQDHPSSKGRMSKKNVFAQKTLFPKYSPWTNGLLRSSRKTRAKKSNVLFQMISPESLGEKKKKEEKERFSLLFRFIQIYTLYKIDLIHISSSDWPKVAPAMICSGDSLDRALMKEV